MGSAKSSVCQRSRSHGSLIPLPCGSENFLSSFPVLSPRWARRATPGKFMLMSAMKTAPSLHHVSQYLSSSSPSILSLSLHLFLTISEYFPLALNNLFSFFFFFFYPEILNLVGVGFHTSQGLFFLWGLW